MLPRTTQKTLCVCVCVSLRQCTSHFNLAHCSSCLLRVWNTDRTAWTEAEWHTASPSSLRQHKEVQRNLEDWRPKYLFLYSQHWAGLYVVKRIISHTCWLDFYITDQKFTAPEGVLFFSKHSPHIRPAGAMHSGVFMNLQLPMFSINCPSELHVSALRYLGLLSRADNSFILQSHAGCIFSLRVSLPWTEMDSVQNATKLSDCCLAFIFILLYFWPVKQVKPQFIFLYFLNEGRTVKEETWGLKSSMEVKTMSKNVS